jgi:hypothetical protein
LLKQFNILYGLVFGGMMESGQIINFVRLERSYKTKDLIRFTDINLLKMRSLWAIDNTLIQAYEDVFFFR